MEFITRRPCAVVPERSKGTTKGLRVINSVDPCVLKSNFLDYRLVLVPLQFPVTSIVSYKLSAAYIIAKLLVDSIFVSLIIIIIVY